MKKAGMYEINLYTRLEAKVETLGKQMASLMSIVSQQYQNQPLVNQGNFQVQSVCSICSQFDHVTEACPRYYYENMFNQANQLQVYQGKPKNEPFSNTYNQGWRNHPNFSWNGNQNIIRVICKYSRDLIKGTCKWFLQSQIVLHLHLKL